MTHEVLSNAANGANPNFRASETSNLENLVSGTSLLPSLALDDIPIATPTEPSDGVESTNQHHEDQVQDDIGDGSPTAYDRDQPEAKLDLERHRSSSYPQSRIFALRQ